MSPLSKVLYEDCMTYEQVYFCQFHCKENMVEGWTICYVMINSDSICDVNLLKILQLLKTIQL